MNAARWLGADPRRVAVLMEGLDRAHRGGVQLKIERERGGLISADGLQILMLLASIFVSLLIAGLMIAVPAQPGPALATAVVALAGFGAFVVAMLLAFPFLLGDDDAPVIGHWPVTGRDVGTARLLALLRAVLRIGVPSAGILSLGPAIGAKPFVLHGLIAWGASTLQAVLVTVFVAWFVIALRRLMGARRAQRWSAGIGIVFLQICGLGATWSARSEWLERVGDALTWHVWLLPPVWFVAWPSLLQLPVAAALIIALATLLGLVVTASLVIRTMARSGRAEAREARTSGRGRGRSWLDAWFRPWLPGDGAVVARRLLMAHVREDWHFALRAGAVPFVVVVILVTGRVDGGAAALVGPGEGFRLAHLVLPGLATGALAALVATTTSRLREAAWVVAVSPAADARWDALQRGMVRALLLPAAGGLWLVLHVIAGSPPWVVLDDLALLVLLHESVLRWTQIAQWRAPFTLDPSFVDGRVLGASVLGAFTVLPATGAWLVFVHARFAWGPPLTYLLLGLSIAGARRVAGARPAPVLHRSPV